MYNAAEPKTEELASAMVLTTATLEAASTSGTELPEHVLEGILSTLGCKDLAAACAASCSLRRLILSMDVWQELCIKRWPRCEVQMYSGRGGNPWHKLWSSRMRLPASLPTALDTARYATTRAQTTTFQGVTESLMRSSSFTTFLESIYTAGTIVHLTNTKPVVPEFQKLQANAGWWLSDAATTVVAAIRGYHEALQTEGIRVWSEVAWKRSALAFLLQFAASTCHSISALERVSRELTMMDATMKDLCAQQQQLGVEACGSVHSTHRKQPGSIPKSHWWMHAGL